MHFFVFLISILFPLNLLSIEESEESIVVKLATESCLSPLYILPFNCESSESNFNDSYLRQLERILTFDLNHNGATFVVKRSIQNDQLGTNKSANDLGPAEKWTEKNIHFIIKASIYESSLFVLIFDAKNHLLKKSDPFPLNGEIEQDRHTIHLLSDAIYKALFGSEGIASTRILYTIKSQNHSSNSQLISEVWECDYDGGNTRKLTQERTLCVSPVYLPPKQGFTTGGFLYVSYLLGQPKIFIAPLKDGKGCRLTYLKGNQLMPAISQQRDKVAFICDVTGNPDLFLQHFNSEKGAIGKPQQIFSAPQATQGSPTFSPDGKRLAFVSDKDGSPKIYTIQIPEPGTPLKEIKTTLISKRNRENSAPCWSPDGSKIAYCARSKGDRQIWVYDFNTNQETQITQGSGHKENPSWAPNSLHIVFNASIDNSSELFLINLNQSEATQITFGSGEKRFPNWEPRFAK